MVAVKEDIESFIDQMADRLPMQFEHVRTDITHITGAELKLTGDTHKNGKPVDPKATYEMEIPVVKGIMNEEGFPIPKVIDHRHLMRLAWLKHGLTGLYGYLSNYLTESQVHQVKLFFMKRNGNEKLSHKRSV